MWSLFLLTYRTVGEMASTQLNEGEDLHPGDVAEADRREGTLFPPWKGDREGGVGHEPHPPTWTNPANIEEAGAALQQTLAQGADLLAQQQTGEVLEPPTPAGDPPVHPATVGDLPAQPAIIADPPVHPAATGTPVDLPANTDMVMDRPDDTLDPMRLW